MIFLLKTQNGYAVDEVASALQKSVRRGLEREALFWALELCPRYEAYLWKRLLTIAYEDVSALVPGHIPLVISRMKDDYFFFREVGSPCAPLVLANAILVLCRALKTRVADNFLLSTGYRIDDGWRPDIPDYALDKHTRRGRQMKRGGAHFVAEGTQLAPCADVADPYRNEAEAALQAGRKGIQCLAWAKEHRRKGKTTKKKSQELLVDDARGGEDEG